MSETVQAVHCMCCTVAHITYNTVQATLQFDGDYCTVHTAQYTPDLFIYLFLLWNCDCIFTMLYCRNNFQHFVILTRKKGIQPWYKNIFLPRRPHWKYFTYFKNLFHFPNNFKSRMEFSFPHRDQINLSWQMSTIPLLTIGLLPQHSGK